jgi:hypothetical protein
VTWQLGAFGLLALALGAGFAWYERVRPDARIVALVGTLAAFAALGRIAFAAVPNVKPTTDIVLIAGYALGGAPGFAVGALAALTSNFFFGQGPWTPWQMAAWGATGVLGALLAWGMRARAQGEDTPPMGRWPLAIVCCAAGFAFTVVQDVGDWVSFSDHSLGQLGVYVGQGLGFDAVHAAGCLAFALALGPALTRSIQRFARRIKVTWLPAEGVVAPLLAAALVLGGLGLGSRDVAAARAAAPAHAATVTSPSSLISAAVNYLLSAENADGGFGPDQGQPSDQLYAGWAALGLAAAGHDLNQIGDAQGLMDYIHAGAATRDVGALERTILVARAAGQSARSFGGRDLVSDLEGRFRADGSISDQVNLTAFAVLALRAEGDGPERVGSDSSDSKTMRWLVRQQDSDGGFSFSGGGGSSDIDDTGAALEALAGDGSAARAMSRAVSFLRRQQDHDGGFPSQPGMSSNAQSTAWAIQGLEAAGVSPASLRRGGGPSPLAYLNSLVGPNGAVRYSRGVTQTPVWVTGEALMAMVGKPLPIAAPATTPPASSTSSHTSTTSTTRSTAPPAGHARATRRARAHTSPLRHAPAPARVPGAGPSLRNQVLAGRLAGALGLMTALALAPVGLG